MISFLEYKSNPLEKEESKEELMRNIKSSWQEFYRTSMYGALFDVANRYERLYKTFKLNNAKRELMQIRSLFKNNYDKLIAAGKNSVDDNPIIAQIEHEEKSGNKAVADWLKSIIAESRFIGYFVRPLKFEESREELGNKVKEAWQEYKETGNVGALHSAFKRNAVLYQHHGVDSAKAENEKIKEVVKEKYKMGGKAKYNPVIQQIKKELQKNSRATARWLSEIIGVADVVTSFKINEAEEIVQEAFHSDVKEDIKERMNGSSDSGPVVIGLDPGGSYGWAAMKGDKYLGGGSFGNNDLIEETEKIQQKYNPAVWAVEVADNQLEYGAAKALATNLTAIMLKEKKAISIRAGLDKAKSSIKLIDIHSMRYALEKLFNVPKLRKKDNMHNFISDKLDLSEVKVNLKNEEELSERDLDREKQRQVKHQIDAITIAWCYYLFHGSSIENRFELSNRKDVDRVVESYGGVRLKEIYESIQRRREKFETPEPVKKGPIVKNRSKLLEEFRKKSQIDPKDSPDIIIEPFDPTVDLTAKEMRKKDINYFEGVSKIVIGPHTSAGHVESGPGKDPNIIYLDKATIEDIRQNSGSELEAVKRIAHIIAHEKGHILKFDPQKGYGSEYEAEEFAKKHSGGDPFAKAAGKLKWRKQLRKERFPKEVHNIYKELKRFSLDAIINILKRDDIGPAMLTAISLHPSIKVRREIAQKKNLPHAAAINLMHDIDPSVRRVMRLTLMETIPKRAKETDEASLEEAELVRRITKIVGQENMRYLEEKKLPEQEFAKIYKNNPEVSEWIKEIEAGNKVIHDFEIRDLDGNWRFAEYFGFGTSGAKGGTPYFQQKEKYLLRKMIKEHLFAVSKKNSIFFDKETLLNTTNLEKKLLEEGIIDSSGHSFGKL